MGKYVLIYEINDYHDCGGGTNVEFFEYDEEEKMHKRVNELANNDDRFSIVTSGYLQKEYEYEPVKIVKEYRHKEK